MKTDEKIVPASGAGGRGWGARGGAADPHVHYTASGSGTQIYAQGRVVGYVRDGTLYKSVRSSVHMLRRPLAWALDTQSLLDAESAGARFVELHDRDTGKQYRASIDTIRRRGFVFDRGHGRQIGLALDLWTVHRPGEPTTEQLSLWGCL